MDNFFLSLPPRYHIDQAKCYAIYTVLVLKGRNIDQGGVCMATSAVVWLFMS